MNLRLEYIICYDTGLWFTVGPESIQEVLLKKDFKQRCTSPVTLQLFVSRHPSNMADGHGMADMSGGTGLGKKGRERLEGTDRHLNLTLRFCEAAGLDDYQDSIQFSS